MLWLFFLIGGVLLFASQIDRMNKKRINSSDSDFHPHSKVADDMNFLMGDNHYSDGGGPN